MNETPTQISEPGQAAKRTFAAVLSAVVLSPLVLLVAVDVINIVLDVFGEHLSLKVKESFVALGGAAVAISVALTRIMAIPRVNDLLTKLGLGAQTKESIDAVEASVKQPALSSDSSPEKTYENFSPFRNSSEEDEGPVG